MTHCVVTLSLPLGFRDILLDPARISTSTSDLLTSEVTTDSLFKPGMSDGLGRCTSVQELLTHIRKPDNQSLSGPKPNKGHLSEPGVSHISDTSMVI